MSNGMLIALSLSNECGYKQNGATLKRHQKSAETNIRQPNFVFLTP